MNKHPFTESFIKTSLNKVVAPLSPTTPTSSTSPAMIFRALNTPSSSFSSSTTTSRSPKLSLWSAATLACIAFLSVSTFLPSPIDAAPATHSPAPKNPINAMSNTFSVSETSPLPLQLQLEAQASGTQKMAYLPTTGPSLDFYYLNYRPSYKAGKSQVDFWMHTPKGTKAPQTASLELYDEFGKIHLATLIPQGTEIPQGIANKNEPFLWKSWAIPTTLKADFNFSEKFRIVLKTSDSKPVAVLKKGKRQDDFDSTLLDFLLVKNNNKNVAVPSITGSEAGPVMVQDRQLRIRGLVATPGGSPNPAKVHVNSVAPVPAAAAVGTTASINGKASLDVKNIVHHANNVDANEDNNRNNRNNEADAEAKHIASGAATAAVTSTILPSMATLLVVAFSAFVSF